MSTRTFRQARKKEDEVDVTAQKFPKAFDNAQPLSTASALWILNQRISQGENNMNPAPPLAMDKEIISKIHGYLRKFKEGPETDVVARRTNLTNAYAHLALTPYEVAQVFSLQPHDLEEAKFLIPSFERYESDAEQELLTEFLMEATKPF